MTPPACWRMERSAISYPSALRALDERERPTLHGIGDQGLVSSLAELPCVTIVGSRRASSYGLSVAQTLGHDLAAAGVIVISGLALGIDGAAHRGALDAEGRTVAVLAGGPDRPYPSSHRELHNRIAATGAVISEHPPGATALPRHFAQRNRIMAALGDLIVIVEAAQPSGTMITADVGLRIGRTVAAVPGQVGARVAAGSNDLLKDGAELVRDARDVLDLLFGVGAGAGGGRGMARRVGPALDAQLGLLLDGVRSGAATVDGLARETATDPRTTAIGLSRLERLGYVRPEPLGGYTATGLETPE